MGAGKTTAPAEAPIIGGLGIGISKLPRTKYLRCCRYSRAPTRGVSLNRSEIIHQTETRTYSWRRRL